MPISTSNYTKPRGAEYDAFISHASADKDAIVRPLAQALVRLGFRIWYDEFELTIGDSLRESIDRGLANSNYGIVILSPAFLNARWAKYELNGLFARETARYKVILPIWHGLSIEEILQFSPMLADKYALSSAGRSVDDIAQLLAKVLLNNPALDDA